MANTVELIVTTPDGTVTRYPVGAAAVIGRHPECEIVVSDPLSSRRHCKLECAPDGTITATDNGSANGTLLNGEPLRAPTQVRHGDTLQIGSTLLVLRSSAPVSRVSRTAFDSSMSIVRLEDEAGSVPSVDFARRADAQMVSDEEAASSDVNQLKRVTERLKLLVDVSREMGASLDPHKLLNTCLEKLFEVFPQADRGIIVLYGPDGSLPTTLTPEKEQGATLDRRKGAMTRFKLRNPAAPQDNEIRLSRTVVNRVRNSRQSVLVSDSTGDAAGLSMARYEIKSLMCAPLLLDKEDLGFIQIETKSRQQAFNPDDLDVMTAVAGQVAVVIRNSELTLTAAAEAAQRENLCRFLTPQLVDQVLSGKLGVELGGVEKKGTIFFSDVVSFTKIAALMPAQSVVTLLNRYFTVMQNIIFQRGGAIDKCAGDQIMAHWGVVGDQAHFTVQAVTAAVEMQNALFMFNRDEARKNEIALPSVPLGHGIGLNSGIVCAGNIGSDRKIEFTVIGDPVNLSARLEALAGRGQTFLGEACWEEIKTRAFCVRMPDCPAKNVARPLRVYSLRGIVPPAVAPKPDECRLEDMLFSLPCVLTPGAAGAAPAAGMVTALHPKADGAARVMLQIERHIPPGTAVTLAWNVPEKPGLPAFQGNVEQCWQPALTPQATPGAAKRTTAILEVPQTSGQLVLAVPALPDEIAAWKPGLVLDSELKSHEEIVRA